MISKKYAQPLFMLFMSFGMSVIMSGVVVAVNTGLGDGFLNRWLYSLMFAFPSHCSLCHSLLVILALSLVQA